MSYLYLIFAVLCLSSVNVLGAFFGRRTADKRDATPLYNFVLLLSVFFVWLMMYLSAPTFDAAVLPYSLLFAVFFSMAHLGTIGALSNGPASLSSLFITLSLIAATVWGFFFWQAPFTAPIAVGLLLVILAIVLCLYKGRGDQKKISGKWIFYVSLGFIGNAGCTIVQRTQVIAFNGAHSTMMMVFATLIAAFLGFFLYLRSDKRDTKAILRPSWFFPVLAGACNALLNLFIILLGTSLPLLSSSLVFPVVSVGGLAVVMLFSLFVFRERLKWWQWLGIAVGAVATVLLSL